MILNLFLNNIDIVDLEYMEEVVPKCAYIMSNSV